MNKWQMSSKKCQIRFFFEQSHNLWDLQFTLYNLRSCKKNIGKINVYGWKLRQHSLNPIQLFYV